MLHFKDFCDAVYEYHMPPLRSRGIFVVEFLQEMLTDEKAIELLEFDTKSNKLSKFYHILNGRGSMPSPYDEYLWDAWDTSIDIFRSYIQRHYGNRMQEVINSLSLCDAFCNVMLNEQNLVYELHQQLQMFFTAPKRAAQKPIFVNVLSSSRHDIIEREHEQATIAKRLKNWKHDSSPIYIFGEDGIGKTTFVKHLPQRFPTYDFYYIQFDSISLLTTVLQLAEESGHMEKLETEAERYDAFARRIRKLRASRRAVLIIDDMDILLGDHNIEAEQTLHLMQGIKLIIVSKDRITEGENVITLSALSADSLTAIFHSIVNDERRIYQNADDSKLLDTIISEDLGSNTFGVVLTAKTMREDDELSLWQLHFNLTNIESTAYQWPNLPVGVRYQPLLKQLRTLISPQRIPCQMLDLVQLILVTPRQGISINDLSKAAALASLDRRRLRELSRAGWLSIDADKLFMRPVIRIILHAEERTKPIWDNKYIRKYAENICKWATEQIQESDADLPALTHVDYIDSILHMQESFDKHCDIYQRILFRRALANMYFYVGNVEERNNCNLSCIEVFRESQAIEYYTDSNVSLLSVDVQSNRLKDVCPHMLFACMELAAYYAMEGDYRQARNYNLLALQNVQYIEPALQLCLAIAECLSEIGKIELDYLQSPPSANVFYLQAKEYFTRVLSFEEAIGNYPAFCYLAVQFENNDVGDIAIPLHENQSLLYYVHRSEVSMFLNDPHSALQACETAERHKEKWPPNGHLISTLYGNKGNAYLKLGDYEKAKHCFGKALKCSDRYEAWHGLGMCEFKLGHTNAREYILKSLYRFTMVQIASSGWYEHDSIVWDSLFQITCQEMESDIRNQQYSRIGISMIKAYEEVFADCPYIRDMYIIGESMKYYDSEDLYFRKKITNITTQYGDELTVITSGDDIDIFAEQPYRQKMIQEAIIARNKLREQFIQLGENE